MVVIGSTVLLASAMLKLTPEKWISKFGANSLVNEDAATEAPKLQLNTANKPK